MCVYLILCDNQTLTALSGITVNKDSSLTIFGQELRSGTLISNAENENGTTALMSAAGGFGIPEILKILIDAGADVNAQNRYGETALMCAVYHTIYIISNSVPAKIEILTEAGADVNLQDDNGDTVLILAAQRKYIDDAEAIIKLLLKVGADIHIKNKFGKTAYDYARTNKYIKHNSELLRLLSLDVTLQ